MGDEARKEAEKNRSPFQRTRVNKAQERQRIVEWARKRQPGQGKLQPTQAAQVHKIEAKASAPSSSIRTSSSAPALRPTSDRQAGAAATGTLPAIREPLGARSVVGGGDGTVRAERAAAYTAHHAPCMSQGNATSEPAIASPDHPMVQTGLAASCGTLPSGAPAAGPSTDTADSSVRLRAPHGSGRGANRLRSTASSMPGLTTPSGASTSAPKDLGTVIYLLGTQSNSMNARRFLDGARRL